MDKKLPRVEREIKVIAYRFYTKHQDRYDSSFQMMIDGEDATIHTLNGARFFSHIREFAKELFPLGVKYVHFTMLPDTLDQLEKAISDIALLEYTGVVSKRGRNFIKVRLSLKGG